jgi:hypothetical protein
MGAHAMGGHGHLGSAGRFAGGRRVGRGYGGGYGYGGDYGCNGYYNDYNGCGYNPGVAIVGGLIGGAMNGFGVY